ncbi:MAG TPA: right-handed parallel beta-helix repeat-containing protein, partial [Candidatus Thermoplasmatota archaeon]|nr:right-handed parallel beta-helix repeat-containing protein [Candidatus Thermoplasmatota archaeon]
MKKWTICVLVCILMIGSTIVPISGTTLSEKTSHPLTKGTILYVGGSGPNNYTKIQAAINVAVNGDTVFVYRDSSPYRENLNVSKSINVIGEDRNTTVIDGRNWGGIAIFIRADDVTISGFTIQHRGLFGRWAADGIRLYGSDCTIKGNIIQNNDCGIGLFGGNQNCIMNNVIRKSRQNGISSTVAGITNTNCTISGNFISENGYIGLGLIGDNCKIYGNTVTGNRDVGVWVWGDGNNVTENNVQQNQKKFIITHLAQGICIEGINNSITRNNIVNNSPRQAFQFEWAR